MSVCMYVCGTDNCSTIDFCLERISDAFIPCRCVVIVIVYMVICVYWFCCQCRDDDAAPFATPKESPTTKTKKSCRSYHCALLLLQLLRLCEGNFLEIGFATGRQKFLFNYQVLCVRTSRRHGHSNKNNNKKNKAEKNS